MPFNYSLSYTVSYVTLSVILRTDQYHQYAVKRKEAVTAHRMNSRVIKPELKLKHADIET